MERLKSSHLAQRVFERSRFRLQKCKARTLTIAKLDPKEYHDDLARAKRDAQVGNANLTYQEAFKQVQEITGTITEFGQAGKKYVEDVAADEKTYTDALAPIIGTRTVSYIQAGIALLKAVTGADNLWRNDTAQAWATHTGGDLTARGNAQRGLANTSSLLADASRASIAEHKAQWWQTDPPNYLQWSADVGAIETTYTNDTTDNILQRAIGVKNAGVKYATDVGIAIKDYDVNTAAAREEYISKLMTIAKSIGDTLLDAERDKEIALADAELQKQLTGNESAYSSAVQAANDAYNNTTTSAEASRKSQEQTARSTMNTKLSNELKDKEADIAAAERLYDQTVASLDAQYGSESSNGDTGVEGATRRSAIKTRDAQYYAARDTSWANTLSGSTTLGTTPWTVKAISAANSQAAYSTSRASSQAAHDAAMLEAIEDWQLSSRESLTDLLFTEGQSRESYNVATSNVYANWENGVGNLLGDEPEGTGWEEGKDSVFNQREQQTDNQQANFKKPYTVDSPEHEEDESERAKSNWAWLQNWNRDRPRYPPRLGGEETTPYVGPSLEILNAHAAAGNLQMEVATVDQKEIDVLYRNNLISPHAYFDALPYLQHGPVRVAVSPQLKNGITAIEGPIKLAGLLEATGGAVEAGVGYCIVWTGVGTPAGWFLIAHGTDHLYAGSVSLYSGIHQKTFVVSGGEYFGKNALGLSDEGAVRFGRIVGFGSDFGAEFGAANVLFRIHRLEQISDQINLVPKSVSLASEAPSLSKHNQLRQIVEFLKMEQVNKKALRREIIEAGFDAPIDPSTPIALARFRKLFPETLKRGKKFEGRLGDIFTRVETIEQTLRLERAGYLVEYEYRVSNSLGTAYADVVGIDHVTGQPVELIQLMRPLPRAGSKFTLDDREFRNWATIEFSYPGQVFGIMTSN